MQWETVGACSQSNKIRGRLQRPSLLGHAMPQLRRLAQVAHRSHVRESFLQKTHLDLSGRLRSLQQKMLRADRGETEVTRDAHT